MDIFLMMAQNPLEKDIVTMEYVLFLGKKNNFFYLKVN